MNLRNIMLRFERKGLVTTCLPLILAAVTLLSSCGQDTPEELPVVPEGAVDMGIVLTNADGTSYNLYWAESNLCESGLCPKPEDFGDYYAWGETQPYYTSGHSLDDPCSDWRSGRESGYYWGSYGLCNGDNNKLTRYCPPDRADYWGGQGSPDGKTEFSDYGYADDAARAVLGGEWRMPTRKEWTSLCEQCDWTWINVNGVVGYQFTADNGNSIFIPAAGYRMDDVLREVGSSANYWSSTADTEYPDYAWYLFTKKDRYVGEYHSSRYYGHSVRPVAAIPIK